MMIKERKINKKHALLVDIKQTSQRHVFSHDNIRYEISLLFYQLHFIISITILH
jgi:uncharacterized membrane protein (UPF0127 family)